MRLIQSPAFMLANLWALGYCLACDQSAGWYLVPVAIYAAVEAVDK